MSKIYYYILGSVCVVYNTHCFSASLLDKMTQSCLIRKLARVLPRGAAERALHGASCPADASLQDIAHEAQKDVGVPEGGRLDVRIVPKELIDDAPACVCSGMRAIYVNNKYLQGASYGCKRCTLYHEATHVKHNDPSCEVLFASGGAVGFVRALRPYFVRCTHRSAKLALYPVVIGASFLWLKLVGRIYGPHCERRADSEGLKATGCYKCVQERAAVGARTLQSAHSILAQHAAHPDTVTTEALRWARTVMRNNTTDGYLSVDEVTAIAAELKKENKLCAYHRSWGSVFL